MTESTAVPLQAQGPRGLTRPLQLVDCPAQACVGQMSKAAAQVHHSAHLAKWQQAGCPDRRQKHQVIPHSVTTNYACVLHKPCWAADQG